MTRFLAFFCIISLVFCGCSAPVPPSTPPPSTATSQAVSTTLPNPYDETFGLVYTEGVGFHPYNTYDFGNLAVVSLLYKSLFVVDNTFTAQPQLAQSYTVSDDGCTHTITLPGGQYFTDGSLLTAQDVVASLTAANQSGFYSGRLSQISAMEATSTNIVTITTAIAMEQLPQLLNIPIVHRSTVTDQQPLGSGPYTLNGDATTLTAVDTPPGSLPETIQLVPTSSTMETRDLFSYGQVDLVYIDPNGGDNVPYLADYELWSCPSTVMQYVGFQTNSGIFADQTLRSAMTYAMNRDAFVVSEANGFALATTLPVSPLASGYDPVLAAEYAFDLSKFQQVIDKIGWEDLDDDGALDYYTTKGTASPTIQFIVPQGSQQRVSMARSIAQQLTDLGFVVNLSVLTPTKYQTALSSGDYDMYLGEVRLSPNFDLTAFFSASGGLSFGGIDQEELVYLNTQMLENSGNGYTLYKSVLDGGWLCPILFKTYGVYTTRGQYSSMEPALQQPFWEVS